MHRFVVLVLALACAYGSEVSSRDDSEVFRSNRTGRVLSPNHASSDRLVYKSGGYYNRDPEQFSYPDQPPKPKADEPPKTPRGFHEFVSGDQDPERSDDQDRGWSPYYLPPLVKENMYDSPSSPEWNVWKREDDRPSKKSDYAYPKYSPEYADMLMMMQTMKKMDSNSKPSILSRILDNPTTLVMATFIPLSLLLAASLPVIVNVMMNGLQIPAFATTATGTKARSSWGQGNSTDFLRPVLESLADFSARYLDSDDCLQKIFCEMTKENTTTVTNIPGAKYLKQVATAANVIVNEDLLSSVGVKNLVLAIKHGKCEDIICDKKSRKLSPSLLNVVNDAIYSYTFKTKEKRGEQY